MERCIIIHTPNKIIPMVVTRDDTIGSVKTRIWSQHTISVEGLAQSEFTFSPLPYQQIIHEDTTFIHDLLTWNHLYQIDLPEVESVDFLSMDKKALDTLRVSQIGTLLATNNGKVTKPSQDYRDSFVSDTDDDDDGFDLSKMLSFDPDQPALPNDTNLKKSQPAQLYLNKFNANKSPPPKTFQPHQSYHFLRLCNQKVKGFVTYGYEQRFLAVQGYMIFIYKGTKEFFNGAEPIESFHIGGFAVFNTCQRSEDSSQPTKYQLVLKSNELMLQGPSPLALSVALNGGNSGSPFSQTSSPLPSGLMSPTSPKSPTAGGGGNARDEVVYLTPEPMAPNDDIICGAFKRDNISRPPKGFVVLTFDDLISHQSVYKFLNALKYQWLTEVSTACATICERRKAWVSEGIFRLSTSSQQLEELKLQLYQGAYTDIDHFLDEHMYTGLMKVLVRELSDGPLLTSLYRLWLDMSISQEKFDKDHGMKEAIASGDQKTIDRCVTHFLHGVRLIGRKLPYYSHNYLGFLFPLLHHVSRFSTQSKMHYHQLSIVFGPNLVRSPVGRGTLQQQADNQLKINDLVAKIIEHGYQLFTPLHANSKPVHHIIMYDLHQPKYLNSVMDDFPIKDPLSSPPKSPGSSPTNISTPSGNASFFTPQVRRDSLAAQQQNHSGSKDDALFINTGDDVFSSTMRLNTINFQHFNPNGGFMDVEEESVAGSFYDSNRVVPLPDELTGGSNALPLPPLPPQPVDENYDPMNSSMSSINSPTAALSTIGLDTDTNIAQQQLNNLQCAQNDVFDPEAFRAKQETERLQQQEELEREQLEEYTRIKGEQAEQSAQQAEKKAKMGKALGAILPFLTTLNDDIQKSTFTISSDLEQSVFEGLQALQTASELVDYYKKNPQ